MHFLCPQIKVFTANFSAKSLRHTEAKSSVTSNTEKIAPQNQNRAIVVSRAAPAACAVLEFLLRPPGYSATLLFGTAQSGPNRTPNGDVEEVMHIVPALWIAWGILAVVTLALYGYRATLTRDEEGQIFLDEAFDHEKAIQNAIVSRVNRIDPVVRTSVALTALLTAAVIVYYAWDMAKSLFG